MPAADQTPKGGCHLGIPHSHVSRFGVLVASVAFLLLLSALLSPTYYSYSPSAWHLPVLIEDHHGHPETWVADLIAREGGFPKASTSLTHRDSQIRIAETPRMYPVEGWEVECVFLQTIRSMAEAVRKQKISYSIGLQFRVRYSDGNIGVFRWETWRYGYCLGPVALDGGGGPAGDLRLVSMQK